MRADKHSHTAQLSSAHTPTMRSQEARRQQRVPRRALIVVSCLCALVLWTTTRFANTSAMLSSAHAALGESRPRLLALPTAQPKTFSLSIAPAHKTINLLATPNTATAAQTERDFSRFSHTVQPHAALSCNACHQRTNDAAVPAVSGHKDCTSCHLAQFVTPKIQMCAICHTNLGAPDPPVKNFPRLASFNVLFDHAQHSRGAARPAGDCAACHLSTNRGIAKTIPAGFTGNPGGHSQCYTCHSPGKSAANLASCSTCHRIGSYRRTPTTARAFRVSFSHADHSTNQNLSCASCHSLRAGLPQSRQVTAPIAEQHQVSTRAQSCMTCHNGRQAFGDRDFGDCKRCHTGSTFRMGS